MKKAVIRNAILHMLIFLSYILYDYLGKYAQLKYNYLAKMMGIAIPYILIGVSIYLLDVSGRKCNALFLVVNFSALWAGYFIFYGNTLVFPMSILLSVLFLMGVIFPKNTLVDRCCSS